MNILPFVFAILFIFAYGIGASMQNQIAFRRNQTARLQSFKAEQRFLRRSELHQFKNLPGTEVKIEKEKAREAPEKESKKEVPLPPNNIGCARLNLYPLINEGREAQ